MVSTIFYVQKIGVGCVKCIEGFGATFTVTSVKEAEVPYCWQAFSG